MKLTPRQYAVALYQTVVECAVAEREQRLANFVKVLVQRQQLNLVDGIVEEFDKYYKERNGILDVEAVTATKVDGGDLAEELGKSLSKKIDLQVEVDPQITAGLILKIGDTLIDGSLKNQLDLLRNKLISE